MQSIIITAIICFFGGWCCCCCTTAFVLVPSRPNYKLSCSVGSKQHAWQLRMTDTQSSSSTNTATSSISIDDVNAELRQVKSDFDERMSAATTPADAEAIRREFMGKKGPIQKAMNYMKLLSTEDKPKLGAVVNEIKAQLEESISLRKEALITEQIEKEMENDQIDVTMPGTRRFADIGRRHPISMTMEKAVDIFVNLGYDTVTACDDSPEIETDYYCFTALNSPKDHPARDMQDTFYLTHDLEYMLRTHTSSVQIRQLEKRKPPLRIVAPGRVYRKDDIDATHSIMFHQVEILALEKRGELSLAHLKGTVEHFLREMLGPDIKVRFRGSYFPFTEPSMEVDVFFKGKWMEVLGCGMVDPNVLQMAGIDPNEYSGFAAGFGVERFTMVIHQINDLRLFFNNDKRFLQQFPTFYDDGMVSFLSGEATMPEPTIEYRGPDVPDPPVDSLIELKSRIEKDYVTQEKHNEANTIDDIKQVNNDGAVKAEKKEKKQQQKATGDSASASSDVIDISKLDIRVGVITKAWEHEEAEKLFCEEIDIGEDEPRQIASGLRQYYTVDQLPGQRVLVLCNLKARKMMGFSSHGMVLCASDSEKGVKFVEPPADAKIGERISVAGYHGEPATENQILKKKMLDIIFPDLKTNADGIATYKGVALSTSAGPCKPTLPNTNIA